MVMRLAHEVNTSCSDTNLSTVWTVGQSLGKLLVEVKAMLEQEGGRGGVYGVGLLAEQPHIEHLHPTVNMTTITGTPLETSHTQGQHSMGFSYLPQHLVPVLQ